MKTFDNYNVFNAGKIWRINPSLCGFFRCCRLARAALVNAALSVGSLVTRDPSAARGFADSARQYLKEIFDVPSEEAASAFLCLAYYKTYTGEGLRADL